MRSVLWFLLIFSATEASSEESTRSNEAASSLELQSPAFAMADAIYDKQKECDSIFGEVVVNALEKGNKLPEPDERYLQCIKTLDEKKRDYIKTALVGLNHNSYVFPMRLSNKRLVSLPVPADESLSGAAPEFDMQQQLCMTNKLCLTLVRLKFSNYDVEDLNEQNKNVERCLDLLNDLKLKYIDVKKLKESELKKGDGLTVMCTDGAVTFTLPEKKDNEAYHTTSPSAGSEIPKNNPVVEDVVEKEDSTLNKPEHLRPYRDIYNGVVKELNSRFEQKSKDEDIADQDSEKEVPINKSEDNEPPEEEGDEKDKTVTDKENIAQEIGLANIKTDDVGTENQHGIPDHRENEISSSDKTQEEKIARSEPSKDADDSQEVKLNNTIKSDDVPKVTKETETKTSANIPISKENEMSPNNGDEVTNKKSDSRKLKSKKRILKPKNDKNVELVTYRLRVLTKNGDGKVVNIQASGRIKKTEINPTSTLQGLSSTNMGSKFDDGADGSDLGLADVGAEANEKKRKSHPESVEENIILMENDCKELLEFGERLLQHKLLSSLLNLENHYNECIERLDALKRMYIENNQVDVSSHKYIFPLILRSGEPKLLTLPTQFLKTDLVEAQSSSKLTPGDEEELTEYFSKDDKSENPTLSKREPFDDPAFISNDEFLEGLRQGDSASNSSTLSKVASMLHMNGGHSDKKIAE